MRLQLTSPDRIWIALFCTWLFILSGTVSPFFGSPGAWQALRLMDLLNTRNEKLGQLRNEIGRLQTQVSALEQSRYAQEREIRRVLGYAAPDELIFDFSAE
ncbi:MAG: hypothetical protein HYX41_07580 [Bdellovibrio sp.]|nr:hypothetical protein [Bdellovibrio sp.]